MPIIRTSTDIINNFPELSRHCKETGEPVYITVNGKCELVLIDINVLDELYARLDLYEKINLGIADIKEGHVKTHDEVFSKFRK